MDIPANFPESEDTPKIAVQTPAGAVVYLLVYDEKEYYEDIAERYQKDNKFTNISDLQELDRILVMETLCFRWSKWILQDKDYWDVPADVVGLQKNLDTTSKEIRALKRDLGIDKNQRDKEHGDSPAEYINNLRLRAKEFGYMRDKQFMQAITDLKEIQSKVQLYFNYNDEERTEFKWKAVNVMDWLKEKCEEFDKIDEEFRETHQKMWIRTL